MLDKKEVCVSDEIDIELENKAYTVQTNGKNPIVIIQVKSIIEVEEEQALSRIIFVDFKKKEAFKIIQKKTI